MKVRARSVASAFVSSECANVVVCTDSESISFPSILCEVSIVLMLTLSMVRYMNVSYGICSFSISNHVEHE